MFKELYSKTINLAGHKSSKFFLGIMSFIESFIFPIPPDVMIAPMAMANKNKFFKIFIIATLFSVLGGMFGYVLGLYFFDFAMNIVEFYNYEEKMIDLKDCSAEAMSVAVNFVYGFSIPGDFKENG